MNAGVIWLDGIAESNERLEVLFGVRVGVMGGSIAVGNMCEEVEDHCCEEPDVAVESCGGWFIVGC